MNPYIVIDDETREVVGATEGVLSLIPELRLYLRQHPDYDPNNLPLCLECGGPIGEALLRRKGRNVRIRYCSSRCSGIVAKRRVMNSKRARAGYTYKEPWDGILRGI